MTTFTNTQPMRLTIKRHHRDNARYWYGYYRKLMRYNALRSLIGAIKNRDLESAFADLM